jgi:hypothetical protein
MPEARFIAKPNADAVRFLSHSELWSWRRCHRRWYLDWGLGLAPKGGEPVDGIRAIGSRVHLALAALYEPAAPYVTERDKEEFALSHLQAHQMEVLDANPLLVAVLESEFELERLMVEGYIQWRNETGADADFDVIGAEQVVTHMINLYGQDVMLAGKLDLRVKRRSTGTRMFLDHKTVQTLKQPTLALNTQMKHYALLQRLIGEPVDGIIYNMLRKVKRTGTAKPPFYGREDVYISDADLKSYWAALCATAYEIFEAERKLDAGADVNTVAYPNPQDTCSWQCPFFAMCPLMDDDSRWGDLIADQFDTTDRRHAYHGDTLVLPDGEGDAPA